MYSIRNFKSKKALKEAVKLAPVACFQPGPFGPNVADGEHTLEGPHYPEPHKFYARVRVVEGMIVKVLS
jgi:hypothetical protein